MLSFKIVTQWDGTPITHEPVNINLKAHPQGNICAQIVAPYFGDPPNPGGPREAPFPGLWNYEVVELFFCNDNGQYLEVELCPHGQHLILLLNGPRNILQEGMPCDFQVKISGKTWRGEVSIPKNYFPANVTKFNAYAIHASGSNRRYEALYPVPPGRFHEPDFHRLEFFQRINIKDILPSWQSHNPVWRLPAKVMP